ncbi:MAG: hypothetical protein KC776_07915 [Myxococcales bacterium]|nr:hypothetical protein [Myxococcales bacterium]MCB9577097.1 hypothetical protein [Polyangiaceae bacterium]
MKRGALAIGLCLGLAASGCGGSEDPPAKAPKVFVTPAPEGEPYDQLSDWHLFENGPSQKPAERVVPYEVISPLWSDGASKHRFIHLPEGKTIGYSAEDRWKFPVGSILVKTFGYLHDQRDASAGERLLETRLLVHESDGWKAHTYVWNDEQTDAVRKSAGTTLSVSTIDSAGASVTFDYGVPNSTKCSECHGKDAPDTLGGKTRQLDRDHDYGKGPENQIDHLYDLGFLDAAPPPAAERVHLTDPMGDAPVAERARSYLDANCSHCHETGGSASQSGLQLTWFETAPGTDAATWGVCKVPTSAGGANCGLVHDIVPGKPEDSVLLCRVKSREPKVQMPPLATLQEDKNGVALLSEWIAQLNEPACP